MILYCTSLLMVLTFLLLTLMVGLYCSQKATTFRAYAVGNKRFHTTTLVITVLATTFGGGSLMCNVPELYDTSLICMVLIGISCMHFWLISLLGLRMGPFLQHLSVAETIGSIYGKYPRVIVALFSICYTIGAVAIQINVMSSAISMCLDSIDPRIITVLAALILITYATLGGIRSITITDIMQFITFTIIIPLLIKFLFIKTGKSFSEIILLLQKQEKFQLRNLFQFDSKVKPFNFVLNMLVLPLWVSPTIIQRVYMASGPIQIKKVFGYSSLFAFLILICIYMIPLFVFVGDPALPTTEIWPYILSDMSPAYKGCVVIGLLGMTMSTADSNLHTAAIMFGHDIVPSLRGVKAVPYVHQLRLAKLAALVTGLLAMIVTVFYPDLLVLSRFCCHYFMSCCIVIIVPPFILAVFGFRSSARTALIGMTIGILAVLAWNSLVEAERAIDADVFFGLIANGLAMMAAHYLLPQPAGKGWVGLDDQQKRMKQLIQAFKKYKKSIDLE